MKRLVVCLSAIAVLFPFWAKTQSLNVISYPAPGAQGSIIGEAADVDWSKYKVAIVNDVFGSFWSKPWASNPSVPINTNNGRFDAVFITGGQDQCSQKIHLFLVPIEAGIPLVLGGATIPADLYSLAVATAVVDRTSSTNEIVWAGRRWARKDTGDCYWGPGPNYFSADNVFVDQSGRLHLTARYVNGRWRCAEVILTESLGYGSYRFYLDSVVTNLPDPFVLGMFTYDDDSSFAHREIDVEFSNGAVVGRDAPWQFVIQPYYWLGQRHRFAPTNDMGTSTHAFLWLSNFVTFSSYDIPQTWTDEYMIGHSLQSNTLLANEYWRNLAYLELLAHVTTNWFVTDTSGWSPARYVRTSMSTLYETSSNHPPTEHWSIASNIPPQGNEKVHINLWLFNGVLPGNTNETYEVIIRGFEFKPVSLDFESLRPRIEQFKLEDPDWDQKITVEISVPGKK
jgi:hypothetical protein